MKRGKIIGIGALVAVLVSGGVYWYMESSAAEKTAQAVETVAVQRMDIKSTVEATGTIRPVDSVEVSSKITARINSVLVKENDVVTAGQVVATLDGKDYEAKRDQAQYRVTNTRAKYNRMSYLESIGAKSKSDLEDAEYNYDTAQSTLEEANSDANETIITAPISGVVVGEPKTAGTMAVQGSDNPTVIMRIADLSKKQIKAKVDETDIGNIRIGQEATFTVDAFTDKKFTARVSKISQTDVTNSWDTSSSASSSSSGTSVIYYYVTLDVDDPENLLLPAMTARVVINTADRNDALVVPLSTLKTDAAGSYVLVLQEDGTQETRYVETGIYSDEYVEILSGLSEGERVVSTYTAKVVPMSMQAGGPPPF
ncbi:efflux RND transporter periplasmic adaptor subunit [Selenomonas sp. oral taxon 138]|uniref:efflux RND transporter periplasmic adaptor subunit n=1 Tax=Selenomonas sp. oral taxon 138 TaxID=712532 RepID=UPI0002A3E199|nr:efflux RND transporter periplasmic adaptor subunit [Selenomonas sp. oral taxon 138]EKX96598.1 efflux transporter, RND family, MFP subunit [Selenomonas sp. oral taxon 138 str. F0429]